MVRMILVTAVALTAFTTLGESQPQVDRAGTRPAPDSDTRAIAPVAATLSSISFLRSGAGDNLQRPNRVRDDLHARSAGGAGAALPAVAPIGTVILSPASRFTISALQWNTWLRAPPAIRR
jgi:hypothetical protein